MFENLETLFQEAGATTFDQRIMAWYATQTAPVPWNTWQRAHAAVRRLSTDAPDTRDPTFTQTVRDGWRAASTELFGSDWETMLGQAADDPAIAHGGPAPDDNGAGTGLEESPRSSRVGGSAPASHGTRSAPGSTALALRPGAGQSAPVKELTPDDVELMRQRPLLRQATGFQTPKARSEATSRASQGSRASRPSVRPALTAADLRDNAGPWVLTLAGYDLLCDHDALASETQEAFTDRLKEIVQAFDSRGFLKEETDMAVSIEQYRALYLKEYHEYVVAHRVQETAVAWAQRLLLEDPFKDLPDLFQLESQVRALCLIAEMSYEAMATNLHRVYATSSLSGSKYSSAKLTSPSKSTPERGIAADVPAGASQPLVPSPPSPHKESPPPRYFGDSRKDPAPDQSGSGKEGFAKLAESLASLTDRLHQTEESYKDKGSALTGLEFKQQLPIIKDNDFDFEGHLREVQTVLDCHAYGRRGGVRPIDQLTVFRKTLADGSTRRQVFDTMKKIAQDQGRLPYEAKEVYDEIIERLRGTIRETELQRQERVERDFHALTMGRLPHATFRAKWEHVLYEMRAASIDMPASRTLMREYLRKIPDEFRKLVVSKEYSLDGEDKPQRRIRTWEDVA